MPSVISASRYLVSFLECCGVDRAYCVPGESYLPVLDAFLDSGIDLITCFHESAAGFMAVADGRFTGRPGICLVSRGPGATNAAIALHTAEQEGVPMILFVGQVPRGHLRRGAFQEIDYARMFGGVCKWVAEVNDPARLPEILARAMHTATDPTPGPVVVVLPEDLLDEPIAAPTSRPPVRTLMAPAPDGVRQTAEMLAGAKRPLILAGGALAGPLDGSGDADRGRNALRRVAEALDVPVAVTFRRHDLFPNRHRLFAGEIGLFSPVEQLEAFAAADVVLAIGTRLGDLQTHGYTFPRSPWPNAALIHVHPDPRVIGVNHHPTLGVACPPAAFLEALADHLPPAPVERRDWIARLVAIREPLGRWTARTADDGVVFGNVIAALREHMPSDAIVATDAGSSAAGIYRYFPFEPPQRLLATVTGCMGFGIPGAVAFALRAGSRRVVALLGDGGFLMSSHELAHAVVRRLPIVFILANNSSLGSIRRDQERMFPGRVSATALTPPDFELFARSHRCAFIRVELEDEVGPALQQAFAHKDGPILVEVRTSLSAILS
jgi:acetolactate synthase-1/2/3 large subunit